MGKKTTKKYNNKKKGASTQSNGAGEASEASNRLTPTQAKAQCEFYLCQSEITPDNPDRLVTLTNLMKEIQLKEIQGEWIAELAESASKLGDMQALQALASSDQFHFELDFLTLLDCTESTIYQIFAIQDGKNYLVNHLKGFLNNLEEKKILGIFSHQRRGMTAFELVLFHGQIGVIDCFFQLSYKRGIIKNLLTVINIPRVINRLLELNMPHIAMQFVRNLKTFPENFSDLSFLIHQHSPFVFLAMESGIEFSEERQGTLKTLFEDFFFEHINKNFSCEIYLQWLAFSEKFGCQEEIKVILERKLRRTNWLRSLSNLIMPNCANTLLLSRLNLLENCNDEAQQQVGNVLVKGVCPVLLEAVLVKPEFALAQLVDRYFDRVIEMYTQNPDLKPFELNPIVESIKHIINHSDDLNGLSALQFKQMFALLIGFNQSEAISSLIGKLPENAQPFHTQFEENTFFKFLKASKLTPVQYALKKQHSEVVLILCDKTDMNLLLSDQNKDALFNELVEHEKYAHLRTFLNSQPDYVVLPTMANFIIQHILKDQEQYPWDNLHEDQRIVLDHVLKYGYLPVITEVNHDFSWQQFDKLHRALLVLANAAPENSRAHYNFYAKRAKASALLKKMPHDPDAGSALVEAMAQEITPSVENKAPLGANQKRLYLTAKCLYQHRLNEGNQNTLIEYLYHLIANFDDKDALAKALSDYFNEVVEDRLVHLNGLGFLCLLNLNDLIRFVLSECDNFSFLNEPNRQENAERALWSPYIIACKQANIELIQVILRRLPIDADISKIYMPFQSEAGLNPLYCYFSSPYRDDAGALDVVGERFTKILEEEYENFSNYGWRDLFCFCAIFSILKAGRNTSQFLINEEGKRRLKFYDRAQENILNILNQEDQAILTFDNIALLNDAYLVYLYIKDFKKTVLSDDECQEIAKLLLENPSIDLLQVPLDQQPNLLLQSIQVGFREQRIKGVVHEVGILQYLIFKLVEDVVKKNYIFSLDIVEFSLLFKQKFNLDIKFNMIIEILYYLRQFAFAQNQQPGRMTLFSHLAALQYPGQRFSLKIYPDIDMALVLSNSLENECKTKLQSQAYVFDLKSTRDNWAAFSLKQLSQVRLSTAAMTRQYLEFIQFSQRADLIFSEEFRADNQFPEFMVLGLYRKNRSLPDDLTVSQLCRLVIPTLLSSEEEGFFLQEIRARIAAFPDEVNLPEKDDYYPLYVALHNNADALLDILLELPNLKPEFQSSQFSPLDYMLKFGQERVDKLLSRYPVKPGGGIDGFQCRLVSEAFRSGLYVICEYDNRFDYLGLLLKFPFKNVVFKDESIVSLVEALGLIAYALGGCVRELTCLETENLKQLYSKIVYYLIDLKVNFIDYALTLNDPRLIDFLSSYAEFSQYIRGTQLKALFAHAIFFSKPKLLEMVCRFVQDNQIQFDTTEVCVLTINDAGDRFDPFEKLNSLVQGASHNDIELLKSLIKCFCLLSNLATLNQKQRDTLIEVRQKLKSFGDKNGGGLLALFGASQFDFLFDGEDDLHIRVYLKACLLIKRYDLAIYFAYQLKKRDEVSWIEVLESFELPTLSGFLNSVDRKDNLYVDMTQVVDQKTLDNVELVSSQRRRKTQKPGPNAGDKKLNSAPAASSTEAAMAALPAATVTEDSQSVGGPFFLKGAYGPLFNWHTSLAEKDSFSFPVLLIERGGEYLFCFNQNCNVTCDVLVKGEPFSGDIYVAAASDEAYVASTEEAEQLKSGLCCLLYPERSYGQLMIGNVPVKFYTKQDDIKNAQVVFKVTYNNGKNIQYLVSRFDSRYAKNNINEPPKLRF